MRLELEARTCAGALDALPRPAPGWAAGERSAEGVPTSVVRAIRGVTAAFRATSGDEALRLYSALCKTCGSAVFAAASRHGDPRRDARLETLYDLSSDVDDGFERQKFVRVVGRAADAAAKGQEDAAQVRLIHVLIVGTP